ncbi:CDP-diacylglycerol--serine O-phosphatidyltransferase [Telmatospirillum siberiense]|uniref:CDP-diacylglycerol--serine O-phosphatidyltransferase n=1 Tax=Telmatospirillum siberiense TaxID=382514 RepID=A0A2N3PTJ9_9PROT|nr:CDP-diacylglycerol--serine O-phosphatidyltransferase [Telmatospirillum siberiense]PKU23732.1 CDP-diacylglycerol--serine O-phosphatidyltransferase [Telmatospirillum siberiense]
MKFSHRRPPRINGLSFNKLIPNILTMLALCAGLTSIRFGLHGKWDQAVIAILLAGLLDGLDGRIARLLHGTSKFGAELDSLSDFVSFGVAPSMLLYFWTMQGAGGLGWALVLLFSVCCALRLARFNTMLGEPDLPPWAYNFFTGVPAPAAAGLVLLPMVISFQSDGESFFASPSVNAVVLITVSFLMVSKIPTYSGKRFRVPHEYVLPMLLLVGILAAFLVTEPWTTITLVGIFYGASIPVSARAFRKLKNQAAELRAKETTTGDAPPTS